MKIGRLSLLVLAGSLMAGKASAATLTFSAASDYDNNFYETANGPDASWSANHGGTIEKTATSATIAIYNTTATGGSGGSGGTGAATLNNNTFANSTIQMDFSPPAFSAGADSIGLLTKINAAGTSGYTAIIRLTGTGSADFRLWDSDSNPTAGTLGTQIGGTQPFTIPANSFTLGNFYSIRLDTADVSGNVQFTGSIYTTGGTQIGNSLSFTDTTAPALGAGQVAMRFGSSSTTADSFDNFSVVPEPATSAIFGLASLALLLRRRRRRS